MIPSAKRCVSSWIEQGRQANNVYDEGQAYTEQEHKDWLEEAGFGDFERIMLPDERSFIAARKMT